MNPFESLMRQDSERSKISLEGECEVLRDALASYNKSTEFRVGDIVRCKTNNKIYNMGDNGLAIVVELLPEPFKTQPEDWSKSNGNVLRVDMIVGMLDGEQDILFRHVDSRRLELAVPTHLVTE